MAITGGSAHRLALPSFPGRLGRLPADVETTLFRIAQEALTDIERHSGSATAEIHFFRKPGELILFVSDHGCGISKETLKPRLNGGTALPGFGIAGMRERIRKLGGLMKHSLKLRRHQSESKPANQERAPRSSEGVLAYCCIVFWGAKPSECASTL